MSRIQKGSDTKEELQQIKGEVIKELGSQRKRSPWLACSLIVILVIMSFIGTVMWALAATGLVTVPGFSSWAYNTPIPARIVKPGIPVETIIEEQVKTTLVQRLQEGGGELQDTSVTFVLTEQSLTASLRSQLETTNESTLESSGVQVTISKEQGMTFFLPFEDSLQKSAMQISILAQVQNGVIELRPQSVRIGSLPIPRSVVMFIIQPFLVDQLKAVNSEINSFVKIEHITYEQGQVVIDGNFAVKILEVQP